MKFLHEIDEAQELFEIVADEIGIDEPYLVEKDYWIMHALWGLQQQGYEFELKGGTSLSKAFKIINRFSEDIDIHIYPDPKYKLTSRTKFADKKYATDRQLFFDDLANEINISSMESKRDKKFDDEFFRNAGISLQYKSFFDTPNGIKPNILLEVGFDAIAPNSPIDISSWAFDKAKDVMPDLIDNRAKAIKCYLPEYTFVEKLQAISTKVRQQIESGEFEMNFLRHFYDVHQLFQQDRVKKFIGTDDYVKHKELRFRSKDIKNLKENIAFNFDSNPEIFNLYNKRFSQNSALYYSGSPSFEDIYASLIKIREIG
ncbi:nucleotidyl transferase AbiEii/AbiGii toxin family protein [Candidatus Berkiella cookevillensis]|uniref:Nucleotidyl transferase AbiEii/AbiGii toxin family protein n=1 Tax=Candidatus Berkiella cookevillensis TaxID=437022 RepID=A0A0Q9YCB9_9GAMM|nr:nucleotidyl transferase AbiEii/AbiGii toxin family protein [Candidatus Berkiella cookevillensis]MCS5708703.1 nucleotidyl transferase AbiEii/AbiGii toxin family protein [Candidatus Berkiella cookevillensis]